MTLHDTDLAQAEERIYRLAERCSLAEEQRDYYKSAFMALTRVWAETLEQRDKALDWAEREQSHRLDIEGSERLLSAIERMHTLQHGEDDD